MKVLPWKDKALYDDQLLVLFFPLQISTSMLNEKKGKWQNCLLHLLSLEFRDLKIPPRADIDRQP